MTNTPIEKVRQLQRQLYVCAKQSRTRRFHALYDRIYRSDVLWEAWRRVRSNGGAAGIDKESIQAIEQRGAGEFLAEIQAAPFTGDQLYGMGLHQLMGTVKYPAQATPRRSSLSRVPENGTHGLKGDFRNGLA